MAGGRPCTVYRSVIDQLQSGVGLPARVPVLLVKVYYYYYYYYYYYTHVNSLSLNHSDVLAVSYGTH